MTKSSIEWTDITWNPTTGCDKISAGCKNCYAEVMTRRLKAMGSSKYANGWKITCHPGELKTPYKWKGNQRVFVNSMSDLFHEGVPIEFIKEVFDVMNDTPQHTYQILTKRSSRLLALSPQLNWSENIRIGVSVESEETTFRINDLSEVDAHVRFLSIEPFIKPVITLPLDKIHQVIVGGESGPGARPIDQSWVVYIQEECRLAEVAFFFKQWGKPKFNPDPLDPTIAKDHPMHAKGGCQLNGEVFREEPTIKLKSNP